MCWQKTPPRHSQGAIPETTDRAEDRANSSVAEPFKSAIGILGHDISEPRLTRYLTIALIFTAPTFHCRLAPEFRALVDNLEVVVTLGRSGRSKSVLGRQGKVAPVDYQRQCLDPAIASISR